MVQTIFTGAAQVLPAADLVADAKKQILHTPIAMFALAERGTVEAYTAIVDMGLEHSGRYEELAIAAAPVFLGKEGIDRDAIADQLTRILTRHISIDTNHSEPKIKTMLAIFTEHHSPVAHAEINRLAGQHSFNSANAKRALQGMGYSSQDERGRVLQMAG